MRASSLDSQGKFKKDIYFGHLLDTPGDKEMAEQIAKADNNSQQKLNDYTYAVRKLKGIQKTDPFYDRVFYDE